jgi:glycosyltransferase involved in cell wall biosynthesis
MRIALVWADDHPLTGISVRYERYLRGFRALGCEAFAVCSASAATGFAEPYVRLPDPAALRQPSFWRSLRLDAAVVITWLILPDIVKALKEACPWVVSVADSDGQVGVRVFPRATFVRSVWQHRRLLDRLRAIKFWAQRYLVRPALHDRPVLQSAERADLVAVGSARARAHLDLFFAHHGRPELARKLAVIPYPVDDCYLRGDVPRQRQSRLVAVGRWDDPQKDAALLAGAVRRVLKARPDVSFTLVGRGGARAFGPLCASDARVRYLGTQPPEAVAGLLKESRSLLMSSRWEGAPVVLNEALSLGCTLVGPASVASLESFCHGGNLGAVSARRSAYGLAAAVLQELKAWDDGRRDPLAIAAAWRPRFEPQAVCRQLLHPCDMPYE